MQKEELFEFYYERSHEFKGYWPDTLEEFCYKYENDENFRNTWNQKYVEHLNKIQNGNKSYR